MLSRPFRGMARGRLFVMLILLLLVEAAGGAGLYVNNRHASAATPPAVRAATPTAAPTLATIRNYPRTVVVGKTETFSVRLPELANQQVTYVVAYPDGAVDRVTVHSDVTGFSQHTFLIQFKPAGRREAIGIGVYVNGQKRAFTQFAVQLPVRQVRP